MFIWAQYHNDPGGFYLKNIDPNFCAHYKYIKLRDDILIIGYDNLTL
ncbi:unnamed protein product, partial [Rotaria sp. Silwood1]